MIMEKTKKLVLFGDSAFAEVAYEYFSVDSSYEVVGFTVSQSHFHKKELFGLPVVPFEEVMKVFPPRHCEMFIALVYNEFNIIRARFFDEARSKGYRLASFVSSDACVWRNARLGSNCFVFEQNVIQPFVSVGDNVVFWSGNHIGHHSRIGSHNFFASHVVISGGVEIGDHNFFGVNSTVVNDVKVGSYCLVGAGTLINKDVGDNLKFRPTATVPVPITARPVPRRHGA